MPLQVSAVAVFNPLKNSSFCFTNVIIITCCLRMCPKINYIMSVLKCSLVLNIEAWTKWKKLALLCYKNCKNYKNLCNERQHLSEHDINNFLNSVSRRFPHLSTEQSLECEKCTIEKEIFEALKFWLITNLLEMMALLKNFETI